MVYSLNLLGGGAEREYKGKVEITDGISREREAGKIPCLASVADFRPWAKIGGGEGGIVLFALPAFLFFCDYFFIFPNQEGRARAALWVCSCCDFGLSFFAPCVELLPIDFHWVESRRVYWNESLTTRSSRDESSTFCTLRHPSVLLPVSTISASACD